MTNSNHHAVLLVYTLLPIAMSAVLLGAYFHLLKKPNRDVNAVALRNSIFEMFLFLTFVILPSVSIKIFSTFACREFDDGKWYLKVDYSIDCDTSTHIAYGAWAVIMTFVFPIGIPAMYWYLLYRKKHLLNGRQKEKEKTMNEDDALREALKEREANEAEHGTLKSLSFLYGNYEPKYWWFEVFETLRKLALTGFLTILCPGTGAQILFSLIMSMSAMRVYSGCKPFVDDFTDHFSEVSQWQLFFTLLGALAMKVNLDGENLQNRGYFDAILTLVQILPVFFLTVANLMDLNEAWKEAKNSLSCLSSLRDSEKGGIELGEVGEVSNPVTSIEFKSKASSKASSKAAPKFTKSNPVTTGSNPKEDFRHTIV
jgi:hypothetical protein